MESLERAKLKPQFWKNKKVFLTGHTGFKGSWTTTWLEKLGAQVFGYSLPPTDQPCLFTELDFSDQVVHEFGDVRDIETLSSAILKFRPDIVLHMAAQPLVIPSYEDPVTTFEVNVMGTVNILQAARNCPAVKVVVNITSDKCYENFQTRHLTENDRLGGCDPYSSSKACSELVTSAFRSSFFSQKNSAAVATARAGNVIGGGDMATGRLIPDVFRAIEAGRSLAVRMPDATRPWQHVLEPIHGYLTLSEFLFSHGNAYAESWNFGPEEIGTYSVRDVLNYISSKTTAVWHTESEVRYNEAKSLALSIKKAKDRLGWAPAWDTRKAIDTTVAWYAERNNNRAPKDIMLQQIEEYEGLI